MARVGVTYRSLEKSLPYLAMLRQVGLEPVSLVPGGEAVSIADCAGLLLTGGTDVSPARYGQLRETRTDEPDEGRDALEFAVLDEALKRNVPVLAICRGSQLFNVFHGGTLHQHIDGHAVRTPEDPSRPIHQVIIKADTRLAGIFGTGELRVNSRHHQSIDRPGSSLVVSALSAGDQVIEGLERPDRRFALAVQWHPEDQPEHLPLFKAFAEAF